MMKHIRISDVTMKQSARDFSLSFREKIEMAKLLDKLGVEYDPSAKYLGRNGKFLGRPERAIVNSCSQDTLYKIRG